MRAKTLKNALSELLSDKLNQCYKEITKSDVDMFKVEYNWYYDGNNFNQYDSNGNVILDEYNHNIKYIPTALQSIIGEREEIPNVYINDITVPISMLVFDLDLLNTLELVLNYFSNQTVGQVFDIDIQVDDENIETYQFTFTIDLPDFDNFEQFQGENAKAVVFQLDGTLTQGDLVYGNDIEYELSIDNGVTYEKLIRFEPSSTRHFNTFTDQKIGDLQQESIEQDTLWSLILSVLVIENSNVQKLLPYADERDYIKLGYIEDYLDKLKLKITYNNILKETDNLPLSIEKSIILSDISYSPSYGDFLTVYLRFLDKTKDEDIEEL